MNQIKIGVGFDVDKSSLSEIKAELHSLTTMKVADLRLFNKEATVNDLREVKNTAKTVEEALESSFNPKTNSTSIAKFNQELSKSNLSIKQIEASLSKAGVKGQNAFRSMASQLLTTQKEVRKTSTFLDSMAKTLGNTLKWSIASSAINLFTSSIRNAWQYSVQLDKSLNDIRIVTEKSADDMAVFAKNANKAAKELGNSTTAYTNASLIYYQQGLSDKDVIARTNTTIKAANVTGQSAAEVSEQLTAVWNGYRVVAEEAEIYVDKLAAVAASTAADLEELSTGMSKVASAANAMGVDIDQLTAQMATIVSVTRQDASVVGTALKTIFARMGDLKVDGVDEFGTSLGEVSGQLQQMGINVLDQQGNLRDMGTVIEEVAAKWGTWTEAQQQAAAVAIAGKRQYNNLIALFENWDMYESSLSTSQGSEGTLQKQQDIYKESKAAKLKELSTAGQRVSAALFEGDSGADLIETLTFIVDKVGMLIEGFGGAANMLQSLGGILTVVFSGNIAQGITRMANNFGILRANASEYTAQLQLQQQFEGVKDDAINAVLPLKQKMLQYANLISDEQREQYNNDIQSKIITEQKLAQKKQEKTELEKLVQIEASRQSNQKVGSITIKGKGENVRASARGTNDMPLGGSISETEATGILTTGAGDFQKKSAKNKDLARSFSKQKTGNTLNKESAINVGNYKTATSAVSGLNKQFKELNNTGLLTEQQQKKLQSVIDAVKNSMKEGTLSSDELENAFKELANAQQNVGDKMNKAAKSAEGLNVQIDDLTNSSRMMGDQISKDVKKIDFSAAAQNITKFTGNLTMAASAGQMLVNIFNIIEDETTSVGEKIIQIISNLAMSIGMIVPIILTSIETIKNSMVSAGSKVTLAWGIIGIIVMAVTLALTIVIKLIEVINKMSKKETELEKAQKHLDDMKQSVQDLNKEIKNLQEEYDNLISKFDSLDDQYLAIDKMIKGTEEWNNAVIKLNSEVLELLDKYPELAQYISTDENGILTISQEGYDALINKQRAEMAKTGRQQVAAQIGVLDAETEVKETALDEKIEGLGVNRKEFIGAVTEAYKENRELFVDSTKDNGAFNEDSAFYKYLQDTFIPNYLGEDSTSGLTILLANRLTENADAIKDLIDTNEKNTTAMKALRKSYLAQLADEMGVNDKDTFSNIESEKIQGKTVSDYKTEITDYISGIIDKDKKIDDTKEQDLIGDYLMGLMRESGISIDKDTAAYHDFRNDIWNKSYDDIVKGTFTINGEEVKIEDLINDAAFEKYEKGSIEQSKITANIISGLEALKMDTRLAYFMNGANSSSWTGMNVTDLNTILSQAKDARGEILIDTDGDGVAEPYKINTTEGGDINSKINSMMGEITTALELSLGGMSLGSIVNEKDLFSFSKADLSILKENFANAFLAAGKDGVAALQNVFSQAAGDPNKTLKLNELLEKVDFTSIESIAQFAAECEKIGINIDFSTGAWADFINEFNLGIALAAKGIDTLRKALAFLRDEIQGLSIGDIIDEETFQELMRLDSSVKDSFVRTSTGYMAIKSGDEIVKTTKNGPMGISEKDKTVFSNAFGKAEGLKTKNLPGLSLETVADLNTFRQQGIGEILAYTDPTGSVEKAWGIINATGADPNSAEYKAALQTLKREYGEVQTFVGNVENGVITQDELDKTMVTEYATSWSDAVQMARNREVGWDTVNDTGAKYWRAQYLAEMGAETDAILKNLSMDELEDHIERVRKLEQDRYSDIEKDIERLGIVAENSIGQKKIETLGKIAEEKSALTATAEERMLAAQTNANNYDSYLRELGINPNSEDVIKKLQDQQLNYGKDSAKWNEIQLVIDALALEEDTVNEYLQKIQEEIDAKFVVFDTALEISLDLTQAQRDWNEFKTKYIKASGKDLFRDLNATEEAKIAEFNYDSFLSDYDEIMNSIAKIDTIDGEDFKFDSALEGSADEIEEYLEKASGSFESAIGAAKDMLDAYNSMQDEIMEAYDKQIEKLSNINSLYSNSVNLLKLIGGTTGKYSEQVNKFLNQTSVNAKKSSDLALEQLTEAQNAYNRDYDKADEETKRHLEENLQAAADKVLETSNTLAEAIANQFKENFIAIFDEVFSGESLKSVSEEWNRELYFDERYLDETNKAYRISELERKIQESIDSTDSYSAQKKLNELRERELKALREKDKLTEADLERAEASYELELKRIALEEAQQTATKMKLTRDAMGNYSYQYVADKDAIDEAQSEYDAAENNLYNLYKDQEKETISELIGKYEEAMEAIGSAQTAEEKDLLFEHYFGADGVIALLEKDLAAIGIDAANSEVYTNPYKETISKLMSANNDSSIRDQYDKLMNSVDEQTLGFRESFVSLEDTLDSLFAEGGSLTTAISNLSEAVKGAEEIDMSPLGNSASDVLKTLFGENGDEGIAKVLQERGANLGNYIDAALSLKTDANTEALNENTLAIKSLTNAIVLQADASDGQMDNKAYDRDLSGLLDIATGEPPKT